MSTITNPPQLAAAQPLQYGSPIGVGTSSASGEEGFTAADVMRVLKQRKLTIILTSIVVYVLVVIATFVILRYFPAYSSMALFELDPPREGIFITQPGLVPPNIMEQMLMTEARKLKQLNLLMDVVREPEFKQMDYFRWYENDAMQAAVGLQDDLTVGPITDTRLIRVALACRQREEARQIVQMIVSRYGARFAESERTQASNQVQGIGDSLDKLRTQLQQRRAEAAAFRERTNVPALNTERNSVESHITILRTDVDTISTTVTSYQSQIDSLAGHDLDKLPLTAEQQLIVESDPQLRFLRSQAENFDIEIEVMLKRIGENHRDVELARARRQGYFEKEVARREDLVSKVRARQVENLRQNLAQAERVLERRQDQLFEAQARQRDIDRNIEKHRQMEEEVNGLMHQIQELEMKKTEAEHKVNDKSRPRLRLVQPPELAIEPSRPDLFMYLSAGFALAFASGIGLAFLREMTDKVVRTPVDVVRHGHISVLGTIPLLDDEEADVDDIEQAVRRAPHSLVAEAFRRTRTNLQFSGPQETMRSILVTSPGPADGKTAIAINLATTIAHSGQSVLLIDCNFRRAGIRNHFPNTGPSGLSNVLIGDGTLADRITKTDLPNLDVLATGPMPPTPAELLGSENMRLVIEEARNKYDHVILDGPPTLLISDATVVATQVDSVIVVARADGNTKGVLKRTREALERVNARVIGAILNGVKARPGGYFKEQYREFYAYSGDETIPAELPEPGEPEDED